MDAQLLPDFKVMPYYHQNSEFHDKSSSLFDGPLALKTSSSWSYCGPLLSVYPDLLPSSFHRWADCTVNGSLHGPFVNFLDFVHRFLEANHISNYWITVRATQGSREFDIPRWHTDDLFYSPLPFQRRQSSLSSLPAAIKFGRRPSDPRQRDQSREVNYTEAIRSSSYAQVTTTSPNPTNWKLSTTLLGPGTLFIGHKTGPLARQFQRDAKRAALDSNPDHICLSVRCAGCSTAAEAVRMRLADKLEGHDIVQAQQGECTFFRVGENEGAVHSEPMCHEDRIFVNVVPGHESDLKNLTAKWGMEYPRAWSVGSSTHHKHCWIDIQDHRLG